ncbi:MAG TPA: ABC transporter permease [Pyrinomonadaceae bacterium]|jgi:putative ABC transport system permease protein
MDNLLQDLRYGFRMMWKSPGFTIVAALALALGIGANTAIFSVVNTILLRPLAYKNPEQLVLINHNYPKMNMKASVSAAGYAYYRDHAQSFSDVAALSGWNVNLTGEGEPERLQGMSVSANLFPMLGAEAARGRVFRQEENQVGNNHVVVLSDAFWHRRFGGDPHMVGKSITLNGESYTVAGIMPAGFQLGRETGQNIDLWSPITFTPQQLDLQGLTNEYLVVLARLKPNVSLAQSQAEMDAIANNLRQQYLPQLDSSVWGLAVQSFNELVVGDIRPALLVLLGAVALVLLIACANVANLLLARAAARQKEIAIRTAMGASRWRVIRQLLTESILLALLGGGFGLLLAMWGVDLLVRINENKIPRANEISLDTNVLLFTLGLSLLTGILFGLVPAFQTSSINLNDTLKEGGRSGAGGMRRGIRSILVVAEVSLAVMLLVAAGLLIRSFVRLQQVNPGFQPQNLLVMQLSLPAFKYREAKQREAFYQQLTSQVRTLPGVKSVGAVSVLPMSGRVVSGSFRIQGRDVPQGQPSPHGDRWIATPDYYQTMGIPLIKGRYFTDADGPDAPGVAIIDETLARKYWPNEDPIGKRITFEGPPDNPRWREVVGIVGHVKHKGLEGESRVQYYMPHRQLPTSDMFLVVQAANDPASLAGAVRGAISTLDKDLPAYRVTTMDQLVADSLAQRRFAVFLLGLFAALAMVLAVVGLYGVMSYMVAQRTREIGIRMALGAQTADILRMVVRQGMLLVIIGVVVGVAASFAVTRVMTSMLFGVGAHDPLTLLAVSLLLAAVALLACLVPARRATKVDPMTALRYE